MTPEQLEKGLKLHERLELINKFEHHSSNFAHEISIESSKNTMTNLAPHCLKLSEQRKLELNNEELVDIMSNE